MNSMYDALSIFSASGMFTFKIGHLKLQVRIKSCRMLDLLLLSVVSVSCSMYLLQLGCVFIDLLLILVY